MDHAVGSDPVAEIGPQEPLRIVVDFDETSRNFLYPWEEIDF